jgi:replicative DNA helicase
MVPEGRVPPQAVEIEAQVLGAMLLEREAIARVIGVLDEDAFYADYHRKIFQSIIAMSRRNEPVDITTLAEELRQCGHLEVIGGETYLAELTMKVTSAANVEYHAKIVLEKSLLRNLITTSSAIASRAYSPTEDALELLEESYLTIAELRAEVLSKQKAAKTFAQASEDTTQFLLQLRSGREKAGLVDLGFKDIDNIVGGFLPGNLIVLAALEKQGKTSLALQSVLWNARKGIPCLIESGEMSRIEIQMRLACIDEQIAWVKVKENTLASLEWDRLFSRIESYAHLPVFIRDGRIHETEIDADIQIHVKRHGVKFVVCDFLQQIDTDKSRNESGEERLSNLAYRIKGMAQEYGVPIMLLSATNNDLMTRGSRGAQFAGDFILKFKNERPEAGSHETSYLVGFEVTQRMGASGTLDDKMVQLRYNLIDGAWYDSDHTWGKIQEEMEWATPRYD